ncbi:MAG TPA: replicative DNA helicase [Clostridiaceae bacterium]|nr:replicative DNA helicase [Clostridiaceae bacterium]
MSERFDTRVPPNNIDAEKSVLGCCMSDYEILNQVTALLRTDAFYQPSHRLIYDAILNLSMSGKAVDTLTVSAELESQDQLDACGGRTYIMALPDAAPLISNALHYASVVQENYLLRQLLQAIDEIKRLVFTDAESAQGLIDLASRKIYEIRASDTISGLESIRDILSRAINDLAALAKGKKIAKTVRTGYPSLDNILTGGLRGGTLNILAARPGMGKSALALNIAQKASTIYRVPVVVFSLEMSKEEIINRMLSAQTQIDSRKLKLGKIEAKDWERIGEAVPILYGAQVHVDDRTNNTPVEMLSKCRQLKMENKCGLIVVDYLQLMTSHRRTENRQQEISDISRALKVMAKELDVPVIALSQLSRAVESRKEARPLLSDLRESGAIEQDADTVMFIYREGYYKDENKQISSAERQSAELILAKNRSGATGTVQLEWLPIYTLFIDPSDLEDPGTVYDNPGAIPPVDDLFEPPM